MSILGDRIRYLRTKNDLNGPELAEKLNVTKVAISNWENGNRTPDINTLCKIADLFDCTVEYLIGRVDDPKGKIVNDDDIKITKILSEIIGTETLDIELLKKIAMMYLIAKK